GGGGGDACVVGLHTAGGDERVGAVGLCPGGDERELSDLVSPERKRDCIVSLDQQARPPAQEFGETRQRLDRRRRWREGKRRNARKRGAQNGCVHWRIVYFGTD